MPSSSSSTIVCNDLQGRFILLNAESQELTCLDAKVVGRMGRYSSVVERGLYLFTSPNKNCRNCHGDQSMIIQMKQDLIKFWVFYSVRLIV